MVREKSEKTAAIILVTIMLTVSAFYTPDWNVMGLRHDSTLTARCIYSFLHVSILHAAINSWCLLGLAFGYHIKTWQFVTAYIIAVSAPSFTAMDFPTVGLSVICFAIFGIITPTVCNPLRFVAYITPMLIGGFFLPQVNAKIHLYGFIAGVFVGLLNMPIKCKKK